MTVKVHLSPVTKKWEHCGAEKRACRYQGKTEHKTVSDTEFASLLTKKTITVQDAKAAVAAKLDAPKEEKTYPIYINDDSPTLIRAKELLSSLSRGPLHTELDPTKEDKYRSLAAYLASNGISKEFEKKLDKFMGRLEDENFHGEYAKLYAARALHKFSFTGEVPKHAGVLRGLSLSDPRSDAFIKEVKHNCIDREQSWRQEHYSPETIAKDKEKYPDITREPKSDEEIWNEAFADAEKDVQDALALNTSNRTAVLFDAVQTSNNFSVILDDSVELVRRGESYKLRSIIRDLKLKDPYRYNYLKEWLSPKNKDLFRNEPRS